MKLHAKNLAIQAGAKGTEIERIANQMIKEGKITQERAEELLKNQ
jgi:hydroxymethylglutaryl-CoA reductase